MACFGFHIVLPINFTSDCIYPCPSKVVLCGKKVNQTFFGFWWLCRYTPQKYSSSSGRASANPVLDTTKAFGCRHSVSHEKDFKWSSRWTSVFPLWCNSCPFISEFSGNSLLSHQYFCAIAETAKMWFHDFACLKMRSFCSSQLFVERAFLNSLSLVVITENISFYINLIIWV